MEIENNPRLDTGNLFDSFNELEKPKGCPNPVVGAIIFGSIAFIAVSLMFGVQVGGLVLALMFSAQMYPIFKGE